MRRAAEVGYLTDAFALDAFSRNVIDAMRSERVLPFIGGQIYLFTENVYGRIEKGY